MLSPDQLTDFRRTGHLTAIGLLDDTQIPEALDDIEVWSRQFLAELNDDRKSWYLEGSDSERPVLRKLDNPVFHRDVFRQMAQNRRLVSVVEQLIGPGVSVFFSQVFCKPPEVGGPKPMHQDNFYFGPDDPEATLTVWIALDTATVENGCLYYGNGTHTGPILPHFAPESEPFNLQIPADATAGIKMTAAPVPRGGISFHHGNTLHQSSANTSAHARRAVAFHYLRNDARLVSPALPYDSSLNVRIT
ncbi:MAG: phytanoyl-CoA dioxygenase family protein [Fuerstiella sp.]